MKNLKKRLAKSLAAASNKLNKKRLMAASNKLNKKRIEIFLYENESYQNEILNEMWSDAVLDKSKESSYKEEIKASLIEMVEDDILLTKDDHKGTLYTIKNSFYTSYSFVSFG